VIPLTTTFFYSTSVVLVSTFGIHNCSYFLTGESLTYQVTVSVLNVMKLSPHTCFYGVFKPLFSVIYFSPPASILISSLSLNQYLDVGDSQLLFSMCNH